jgi:hypothetical protein
MALKLSTGLRNKLLDTSALRTIFNLGFIKVYAGTVPSSADDAIVGGTHTLLYTISVSGGGTGVTFAASASGGSISKNGAETWQGTAVASATASFYRLVAAGDTGASSTTEPRVQGAVGTAGAEMNVASTAISNGVTYTLDSYSIGIPTL